MKSNPYQLRKSLTQVVAPALCFLTLLACLWSASACAQTYELWVDASRGNDRNAGTARKPLQSLGRAIAVANAISGGTVDIKVRPGTYPVVANTTITRDHLSIEGLSSPILNRDGYLDHFANPVTIVAANLGDTNLWINVLLLVRASDVALSGLSFFSNAEAGAGTNVNLLVNLYPLAFEGQWPSPRDVNFTPRTLTGESVRLCNFDGWPQAAAFNYASGTVEQCKVQHCFVGFYAGPSPGGGRLDFNRNHLTLNFEASLQVCGTPNFWSAPAQPASLVVNASGNLFENGLHLGAIELFIRDYTPSAMDQPGYLEVHLTGNTFRNNSLADLTIVDLSHDHYNTHLVSYNTKTPPVTVAVALAGNSFQGPELTAQITFQEFRDLYDYSTGEPLFYYPWIPRFVQNAAVVIDDPEHELADCTGGTRSFQYRIRQTDNDFLYWNGHSLAGAIPSTGFGVTVPPCQ